MPRLVFLLALALLPLRAGAQALPCHNYVVLSDEGRVLVTQGLMSGYLLAARIAHESSLSAVDDDRLGPGLRKSAAELSAPLTRLQGKTPRVVADELRAECGRPESMKADLGVAFATMLWSRPPKPKPKQTE